MALDRVTRRRQFEAAISQNRDQLSLLLPLHEDEQEDIPVGTRSIQWPVPKGEPYPRFLRNFANDPYPPLEEPPGPTHQTEWPVPKGRPYPLALRTFLYSSAPALYTLTYLRPAALGSLNEWAGVTGAATKWEALDEEAADENTSYVNYDGFSGIKIERYPVNNPFDPSDEIVRVDVIIRALVETAGGPTLHFGVRLNGVDGTQSRVISNTGYQTFAFEGIPRPGGGDWQWDDFDSPDFELVMRVNANENVRVTQIFAAVLTAEAELPPLRQGQGDWPLPKRRTPRLNTGFTDSSIYGHPPVTPHPLDNPVRRKSAVQGFETTPSLALTFVEELPPPSLDWALPRRRAAARQDFIQPSVQAEVEEAPLLPVDFPNPQHRVVRQPQGYILSTLPEEDPRRPHEFPNPRRRTISRQSFLYSNFTALSFGEEVPFRGQPFPNPVVARVRPRPSHLRTYDEDFPVRPHEWVVPKGRPFPAHLRSFLYSSLYIIPPPETPLRPFDWPNPKRRVPRGEGSTFHNTPLINQPPETPIRPFDWTNPRVKPYPRIRGFIQFVMPPPQPPIREFNWPVPRGRSQAIRRQPQIPPSYMVIGILPEPGDFGGTVVRLREYEAFVSFPVYSAVVQFPLYSDELRMPEYEESLSFPSYELYSPVNRRR
jgi:hypothetical protein